MKDYLAAIEEMQEKLQPLQDEAFNMRDQAQKVSSALVNLGYELDKMKLAFLKAARADK